MNVTSSQFNNNVVSYTVTSKFKQPGVAAPYNATVILLKRATQNTFYDKHVLRLDESSRQTWDERKHSLDNAGFDPARHSAAASKGIFTGSNWSTFIRLKNIDIKEMVYGLAKALLENYLANNWPGGVGSYVVHLPIHAEFNKPQCVVTFNPQGNKSYHRSVFMGATLVAAAGRNLTFDLNHCSGAGPV
jgi:hypothetical protein